MQNVHEIRDAERKEHVYFRATEGMARELVSYELDLVKVQEGRWEKKGPEKAEYYTFFYLK
jgi:hypothetical protein